ncbi:hypothetical protein Trydic_g20081 [Trypoxylus dichotomus]
MHTGVSAGILRFYSTHSLGRFTAVLQAKSFVINVDTSRLMSSDSQAAQHIVEADRTSHRLVADCRNRIKLLSSSTPGYTGIEGNARVKVHWSLWSYKYCQYTLICGPNRIVKCGVKMNL